MDSLFLISRTHSEEFPFAHYFTLQISQQNISSFFFITSHHEYSNIYPNQHLKFNKGFIPPHLPPHNHRLGMVDRPPLLPRRRLLLRRTPQLHHPRHDVFLLRLGIIESILPMEEILDSSSIGSIYKCCHLYCMQWILSLLLYRSQCHPFGWNILLLLWSSSV